MVGAVVIVLVILNGHSQAQHMVESQPMKMSAAEALWNTESPASFSLLTIGDLTQRREVFSIRLPRLLCLLSYNQLECEIKGLYDLQGEYQAVYGPGEYIPPVGVVYWSFRIMVGVGFVMLALALYALFLVMGDMLQTRQRGLRVYVFAIALPYLGTTFGWIMTEVGRMPWVVYGLMTVDKGVSPLVSAGMVGFTLLAYTLVYAALIVADIYLLNKYARIIPEPAVPSAQTNADEDLPSLVGAQG
jgi:cytochrome d ubiquinol oxidase subunit I